VAIPPTALIVDDERHIRTYLRMLLKQLGVGTIYEAANVVEARAQLAAFHPALVTLDVNMPGGTGIEFLNEIRAQDEQTYVVVMSADALASTVKAAAAAGADGFIRKDLPPPQMQAELQRIFTEE